MDRRRHLLTALAGPLLAAALIGGCDPKLTGTDGGTGGGGADVSAEITPEALIVGNVITLHAELLAAALSVSAAYDTASAGGAPLRSFFTSDCVTVSLLDPVIPMYDVSVDSCVDAHGTTYRGGGATDTLTAVDGYVFFPYPLVEDTIIATNLLNDDFNHTFDSGTLELHFHRDASGAVSSVTVGNYLRHTVRDEVVTFSYDNVSYEGPVGSYAAWPAAGGVVRIGWNSVGLFNVTFSGSSSCSYRVLGADYACDLTTGAVSRQ